MTPLQAAQAKQAFLLVVIKALQERIEAAGKDLLDEAEQACRDAIGKREQCCRGVCSFSQRHVRFVALTAGIDELVVREIHRSDRLDTISQTLKQFCSARGIPASGVR